MSCEVSEQAHSVGASAAGWWPRSRRLPVSRPRPKGIDSSSCATTARRSPAEASMFVSSGRVSSAPGLAVPLRVEPVSRPDTSPWTLALQMALKGKSK
jgi:hypothetical protein